MSLNAATIEILIAKGLSAGDILEVARATEIKADRTNAERQARYRAKKRNAVTVTPTVPPNEDILTPSSTDSPDEASASSPSRQPVSAAIEVWNETAVEVGWTQIRTVSPNRSKSVSARLREHGLDGWKAAIARARASPYLAGPDPPSWFTFDWIVKSGNFLKLIEGNYDRSRTNGTDPAASALNRLIAGSIRAVG